MTAKYLLYPSECSKVSAILLSARSLFGRYFKFKGTHMMIKCILDTVFFEAFLT